MHKAPSAPQCSGATTGWCRGGLLPAPPLCTPPFLHRAIQVQRWSPFSAAGEPRSMHMLTPFSSEGPSLYLQWWEPERLVSDSRVWGVSPTGNAEVRQAPRVRAACEPAIGSTFPCWPGKAFGMPLPLSPPPPPGRAECGTHEVGNSSSSALVAPRQSTAGARRRRGQPKDEASILLSHSGGARSGWGRSSLDSRCRGLAGTRAVGVGNDGSENPDPKQRNSYACTSPLGSWRTAQPAS